MVNRSVRSNYSQLTGEVPLNIKSTASIGASLGAGSSVYLKFVPDPTQPTVTSTALQVPPDEAWVVFDVYSPAQTPAIDGYITFTINRKPQNITFGPLSATYKNVFGYLEVSSAISANPNSQIQAQFVTDTSNGTVATTVSVNVRIKRIPSGYTGKLVL